MADVLKLPQRFKRPQPPADHLIAFEPAPELAGWLRRVFIEDAGPLFNERYQHLTDAHIACLWTNIPNSRNMRTVLAQAEIMPPMAMGKWQKARAVHQIEEWFGEVPDFLLTFDAGFASQADDVTFCAVVEHEMHHCGRALDQYGQPRFHQDGSPMLAIQGHDVEEFVGVVERYGAAATGMERMKEALNRGPTIAIASITAACGTCQARKRA